MARNPQQLVNYFHELFDRPFSMQTFDDRLLFQKRVYLLQELFGIPLGYSFGWYIHGPYSSELTRDGFENESMSQLFYEKWNELSSTLPPINQDDREEIGRAKEFYALVNQLDMEEGRFLELLSSLHFLKANWYPQESCADVGNALRKIKPQFTREETQKACELLQSLV